MNGNLRKIIAFPKNVSTDLHFMNFVLYPCERSELGVVLSCALFWQTKIDFVRNLVPKIATTQKGLANLFPFAYMLPNSPYK